MSTDHEGKKKTFEWLKYFTAFCIGFITNFSGVLENITKFPANYHEFKATYLYDRTLLNGHWSTNAEYLINSRQAGLDMEQPNIVLNLNVDDDGGAEGEIISQKLCDALPVTWLISLDSDPPSLKNIFFDRVFFIEQLHNGGMDRVAELKLIAQNKKFQTITFKTIEDHTNSLPEFITFGKNLPSYKEDLKKLSSYCANSTIRALKNFSDTLRSKKKAMPNSIITK